MEQQFSAITAQINIKLLLWIFYHFLDIFEEREIADPPDLIDTDPLDDNMSTELGALLGISMLFYFKKSSINGPRSGKSSPKFLNSKINT